MHARILPLAAVALAWSAAAAAAPPRWIVTVEDGVDPDDVARAHGVAPSHVFRHALRGFAGSIDDLAREGLLGDGRVRAVEADAETTIAGSTTSWALDRLDEPTAGEMDGDFTWTGRSDGVTAYVLDSGIRYDHQELTGRAWFGYDAEGGDGSDCYGHGTHVAGLIGGASVGVARDADLVSVRVLDCGGFGTVSWAIAGLDWVLQDVSGPSVVNMSLIAPASSAFDEAVQRVIDAGVPVVVAAGNMGADACGYSPAGYGPAFTVGATDRYDQRSGWSNHGACVDVFAPGQDVISAYHTAADMYAVMSGTSMASPIVAGIAANVLGEHPGASPDQVAASIVEGAHQGVVRDALSAASHVASSLTTLSGDAPPTPEPVNSPPVADFDWSCADLTCTFTDRSADPDGSVVSWAWDFADGAVSSEASPSHTFASGGTWPVLLAVTDDAGATDSVLVDVTVTEPAPEPEPEPIDLTVVAGKDKGRAVAELAWSGASTARVEIVRDGRPLRTTGNDGADSDLTGERGKTTHTYQLCDDGWLRCSPEVTATW